ncbi:MAG: hypothetical protein C0501_10260 [Isosphaera sp.]|nr:hypothetical protein [Isosphaera sp.]
MATTLKTLVRKTVTVTSAKLATPADRIGLGLVAFDAYPADPLSPNPAPVQARVRRGMSAAQLREQMRAGEPDGPPAGTAAGCPSAPGLTAGRSVACRIPPFAGWRLRTTDRTDCPRDTRHDDRLGRDCQSPDRSGGKWVATRAFGPVASAGK